MDFILVRHVETTANVQKRFSGISDVKYTPQGEKQFIKLTHFLKKYSVDIIYSSPLSRALRIAQKVGEETHTPVKIIKSLAELNFGVFENLTFEEIQEKYYKEWMQWEQDALNYQIPKGDSFLLFHKRIGVFLDSIKNKKGVCMIVTHGGSIQCSIAHLLDLSITDGWHFFVPLGGIVEISYQENFGVLKSLVDFNKFSKR
ncbi:histidine phosphatase family protein [Garciella nitratireducens]|uniref:histidine phosphatase family protein n=1 Tax=Garciella nitratireducens TaxID=218205 RepID=UPI001BD1DEA8|nr:histidine phosphatase family protein [Garciella nitratireducens]